MAAKVNKGGISASMAADSLVANTRAGFIF